MGAIALDDQCVNPLDLAGGLNVAATSAAARSLCHSLISDECNPCTRRYAQPSPLCTATS